jgi:hypothetical protein
VEEAHAEAMTEALGAIAAIFLLGCLLTLSYTLLAE